MPLVRVSNGGSTDVVKLAFTSTGNPTATVTLKIYVNDTLCATGSNSGSIWGGWGVTASGTYNGTPITASFTSTNSTSTRDMPITLNYAPLGQISDSIRCTNLTDSKLNETYMYMEINGIKYKTMYRGVA